MSARPQGPIDARLEPALDEAEAARIWQRVRETQAARRRGPRRAWVAGAIGLAVAAALAVWWLRPASTAAPARGAGPLVGEVALDPGVRLGGAAARAVAMADGSRVELDERAELEVLANEGDKFVTAVRRGRARFDVEPGGPRRWVIETDLATVEVVGTAFAVDRQERGLTVSVERGVVLVRGERVPGRVVRLTAGERVEVLPEQTAAAPPAPSSTTRATPTTTAPIEPPPMPAVATAATKQTAKLDGAAVIARADERIAKGDAAGAAELLDGYLDAAPADASAGLAAFLLGRLAQDNLGDPDRAAAAFARVLAIGSPRAVQEEALARRATALAKAGRVEQARDVARGYLARFPAGTRIRAMTDLAGP